MEEVSERILQDDEDFLVELINWKGKPAVKKNVKATTSPERAGRLQNEAYGMHFLSDLAKAHSNLKLYIPTLFDISSSCLIREYIDAEPLSSAEMPEAKRTDRLDKLSHLLAGIDRIKPYGEVKFVGHFDYRNIRKNFPKWTDEPVKSGLVTAFQVDQVNKMLDELEIHLEPRLTHGDLSPHAHAYLMPDDKIAFIDLENFTPGGARYYDVARVYVRLFSFEDSTDAPKAFLSSFLKYADNVEHRTDKLLAIFLQRTLGMQYDAWYDAGNGTDYRDRAKELMNLVLQGRLELLYK